MFYTIAKIRKGMKNEEVNISNCFNDNDSIISSLWK